MAKNFKHADELLKQLAEGVKEHGFTEINRLFITLQDGRGGELELSFVRFLALLSGDLPVSDGQRWAECDQLRVRTTPVQHFQNPKFIFR